MAYRSFSTGLASRMLGGESGASFATIFAYSVLYVYPGSPPASADSAVVLSPLAIVTTNGGSFAFGTPTNGLNWDSPLGRTISKAAADAWQAVGLRNGTAGWARLYANDVDEDFGNSATLQRVDMDIANSGATWLMANTTIETGAPMSIAAFTVTLPTT